MDDRNLMEFCSALLDRITVIKGLFELQAYQNNDKYSGIILEEVFKLEQDLYRIIASIDAGAKLDV